MKQQDSVEIRIPQHLVAPLRVGVAFKGWRESVVFGLASHVPLRHKTLLLIKRLITLPDAAYVRGSAQGAQWRGRAMLPILNQALEENLGVVIFHTHPHSGRVSLSEDDRQSATNLLPMFQTVVPSRPHASMVFGNDRTDGLVLMPDRTDYVGRVRVRWFGKVIRDFISSEDSSEGNENDDIYRRQALLTGREGEKNLRQAKVAVVGLSGGGTHVVQQLAHLGVGEIIGIDGDRAEKSNRSRLIGMSASDALLHRRKTSVMARMVRRINRRVKFSGVPYPIPRQPAVDALKESDIVVGCLDNYHARADLQELAWRYMIPYVDIGLLIQPLEDGIGITIGGNVATLIPGSFCQWCIDFLTDKKLSEETGGRSRSYFQGADEQAQVVSMNGVLASQAVNEVLQLLTGFAPVDENTSIKKFDGLEGTLVKWDVEKKATCAMCVSILGAGDIVWSAA